MDPFKVDYFFDLSKYEHAALFQQIDYAWEALDKISDYLTSLKLGVIEVEIPPGAHLIDSHLITIKAGTIIEPGAYIKGPCYIGRDCIIRHGAYVRGDVITGNGSIIGHATEVKNSIFFNHSYACHFNYVGDSILGNQINLGAGTILANLKLDNSSIKIKTQSGLIDTGRRKFGAILGDGTQTGCNTVANPGTLLGKNVRTFPGTNLGGIVPSGCTVRRESCLIID